MCAWLALCREAVKISIRQKMALAYSDKDSKGDLKQLHFP